MVIMIKDSIEESSFFGGFVFYLAVIFMFLIFGMQSVAIRLILGLIFAFVIITVVRLLWFRQRPVKEKYRNIIEKIDASSFPSMHSLRAMFMALVLIYYFNNIYVALVCVIMAVMTGVARIYRKRHFVSDILGGYCFGIILFYLLQLLYL